MFFLFKIVSGFFTYATPSWGKQWRCLAADGLPVLGVICGMRICPCLFVKCIFKGFVSEQSCHSLLPVLNPISRSTLSRKWWKYILSIGMWNLFTVICSCVVTLYKLICFLLSGGWGYGPRYGELAQMIKATTPSAEIHGQVGRRSNSTDFWKFWK